MAETVSTGGTKAFHYGNEYNPKLKDHEKKEIGKAYDKYYDRKRQEKKRKAIITAVIITIVVVAILWFAFKKF